MLMDYIRTLILKCTGGAPNQKMKVALADGASDAKLKSKRTFVAAIKAIDGKQARNISAI